MNKYQARAKAKKQAAKAEVKATEQLKKFNEEQTLSDGVTFPDRARIIVHGETDFIEFKFKKEDFEKALRLPKNEIPGFVNYIGKQLDRPELGMKTVRETASMEELIGLGTIILTYVANIKVIELAASKVKPNEIPVIHFVSARSIVGGVQGYSIRNYGITNYTGAHAQEELQGFTFNMLNNGTLLKALKNGEYHPTSMWYRIASLLTGVAPTFKKIKTPMTTLATQEAPVTPANEDTHAKGWHWVMTEETKQKISDALTGMRYKTKSREGVEWEWVNGRKEWIA